MKELPHKYGSMRRRMGMCYTLDFTRPCWKISSVPREGCARFDGPVTGVRRCAAVTQACDEEVWREIDLFKAALRRMVAATGVDACRAGSRRGKGASAGGGGGLIFLETGGKPGASTARHAFIEAIPVRKNAFMDAPMYFRQVTKGILFMDSESVPYANSSRGFGVTLSSWNK